MEETSPYKLFRGKACRTEHFSFRSQPKAKDSICAASWAWVKTIFRLDSGRWKTLKGNSHVGFCSITTRMKEHYGSRVEITLDSGQR